MVKLKSLLRGEESLFHTFWLYYFVPLVMVRLIGLGVSHLAGTLPQRGSTAIHVGLAIVEFFVVFLMGWAIYASARSQPKFGLWGILACIVVVLNAVRVIFGVSPLAQQLF
jgi:hypothetical protein